MKALVTGANGFIGRHLCRLLETSGLSVTQAVRVARPGAVAIGDIDGNTDWHAVLRGVDAVVHLAARAHILKETASDPLASFREINTDGTLNLARQAALSGVRRFVLVSSIGVHGLLSNERPFTVNDPACPHDAYARSKWEAELGLQAISGSTGMEVIVIRPPLVYGPGVGANFRRLMKLAASGFPLPLAAIENRRSLVYVDNLCDLIRTCLAHPAAAGHTFLVSDDRDLSTPDLFRLLARTMGKNIRLFPMPVSLLRIAGRVFGYSSEIERLCGSLCVDISHTKAVLGWRPPFALEDGIRETAKSFLKPA
jgi:nucleoside-diphosphate-sugar epimerase